MSARRNRLHASTVESLLLRREILRQQKAEAVTVRQCQCHVFQIKMLAVNGTSCLYVIIQNVQYYSIICDKVTDQDHQHRFGILIQWTDENFGVHRDLMELGLWPAM